jgi:retron-type reverse transcriptase
VYTGTLDEIFTLKGLKQAYGMLAKKHAGLDEVSVAFFEEDLGENLEQIRQELLANHYAPEPLSRIYIPKEQSGQMRPLGLGAIKDKVIQKRLSMVLGSYFETLFSDKS